jgi:hypothetical protein
MSELDFTGRQIREMRQALGLQPGDYLDAAALLAVLDANEIIVSAAAEREIRAVLDEDDGP